MAAFRRNRHFYSCGRKRWPGWIRRAAIQPTQHAWSVSRSNCGQGLLLSGIITLSISNWSESAPEYGRFPAWFPVLVITRDAVILVGAAILHLLIGNKMRVKPNWTGKVATVCQMCAIAWVMLQLRFLPLLLVVIVAGIFTLISGVVYVLDGVRQLQAEGHAHPQRG